MLKTSAKQNTSSASSLPLSWRVRIPAYRYGIQARRLFIYLGFPGILILLVLWQTAKEPPFLYFTLLITGLVLILSVLIFIAIRKGTFEFEFFLDDEGIRKSFLPPAGKIPWYDRIAFIFLLSDGMPGEVSLTWSQVQSVSCSPFKGVILLSAGAMDLTLICHEKDWPEVSSRVGEVLLDREAFPC